MGFKCRKNIVSNRNGRKNGLRGEVEFNVTHIGQRPDGYHLLQTVVSIYRLM